MDELYKHYNSFTEEELSKMPSIPKEYLDETGYAMNVYWDFGNRQWEYIPMD